MTQEEKQNYKDETVENEKELQEELLEDVDSKFCMHNETVICCDMCGREATGDMLDMQYCPDCRDHTSFSEICCDCDYVVTESYGV